MSADRQTIYIANIGDGRIYQMDREGNERIFLDSIEERSSLGAANFVFIDSHDRFWISVSTLEMPWWPAAQRPRPDGYIIAQEIVPPGDLGRGAYVDGFAFDAEGNIWVTLLVRNEVVVITPDGDVYTILSDVNEAAIDNAEAKMEDGTLTPMDMFACAGAHLQLPASITFGGPDLRTVYLGSLGMNRLPTFRSPVPGLPMRHWE